MVNLLSKRKGKGKEKKSKRKVNISNSGWHDGKLTVNWVTFQKLRVIKQQIEDIKQKKEIKRRDHINPLKEVKLWVST